MNYLLDEFDSLGPSTDAAFCDFLDKHKELLSQGGIIVPPDMTEDERWQALQFPKIKIIGGVDDRSMEQTNPET